MCNRPLSEGDIKCIVRLIHQTNALADIELLIRNTVLDTIPLLASFDPTPSVNLIKAIFKAYSSDKYWFGSNLDDLFPMVLYDRIGNEQ